MLALLVSTLLCGSSPPVEPDPARAVELGALMELFLDETGALDPESALASPHLVRLGRAVPSWGFGRGVIWARFTTPPRGRAGEGERWLLRAGFPRPERIELWQRGPGGALEMRAAGGLAESAGFFVHDVVLPIDLDAGEHLVRIETQPARVNLELVEAGTLADVRARELMIAGLYYGIFCGLFLYNLFLGFSLKDGTHVLYCVFLVCMAQHVAARDGLGFADAPVAISRGGAGLSMTALILLVFARRFLRLPRQPGRAARVVDRVLRVELAVCAALALAAFAGARLAAASAVMTVVTTLTVVVAAAVVARHDVPARWFLLAWSVLIASSVWSVLHAFGHAAGGLLTAHGLKIGSALEMVLLSLALAARVRALRAEKDAAELALASARADAQAELAGRVIEAQEEERARFARELHDGLGHALLSIRERLAHAVRRGGGIDVDDAKKLGGEAQRCIDDARAMARALVPPSLAGLGVVEALRAVCADFGDASGVTVRFDDSGAAGLDDVFGERAIHLVRITQEALANAVRHGGAAHIDVALRAEPGEVLLTIADDGAGFDTSSAPKATSLGLLDMAQRARLLGGALDVGAGSAAQRGARGTRVTCRVPHVFKPALVPPAPPAVAQQKEAS